MLEKERWPRYIAAAHNALLGLHEVNAGRLVVLLRLFNGGVATLDMGLDRQGQRL